MRVLVTSHSARFGGGIPVAKNLISAFGRVAPEHEYLFTIPPGFGFEACCRTAGQSAYVVFEQRGLLHRWCWENRTLPGLVRRFQPDVVFNMANRGFLHPPCPQATLIQDPHLFYPFANFGPISAVEWAKFRYHRQHLRRSLRRTPLLFCQTEVARERLRMTYGAGPRIALCPNHLSTFAGSDATVAAVPRPLQAVEKPFKMLVLTRYYAHKNLEILPRMFAAFPEALRDVAAIVTIAPDQHPNAARLLREVRDRGLEKSIVAVGAIPHEELAAWYRHTDALFMPTLLESFSGTYLEAMAHERPILTSDLDFAHEVCGQAALYFDPRDPQQACREIIRLKDDPSVRAALLQAGGVRRQARTSSWDEIAVGVLDELRALARRPPVRP